MQICCSNRFLERNQVFTHDVYVGFDMTAADARKQMIGHADKWRGDEFQLLEICLEVFDLEEISSWQFKQGDDIFFTSVALSGKFLPGFERIVETVASRSKTGSIGQSDKRPSCQHRSTQYSRGRIRTRPEIVRTSFWFSASVYKGGMSDLTL